MKEFLYFSASWCGPCLQLGPTMDQLSREGINVRKIDVDSNPALTSQYNIRNVPTVILIKNSQEIARQVGNQPKSYYNNLWQSN
jgi:thioredoxin 1